MPLDRRCLRRALPCSVAFVLAAVSLSAGGPCVLAQEAAPSSAPSDPTPAGEPAKAKPDQANPDKARSEKKSKPHRGVRKPSAKTADSPKSQAQDAAASAPRPSGAKTPDTSAANTKSPPPIDFMAQLAQAGVSACRNEVNTLATSTMGQVEKFNTVSNWSKVGGNKRAVSLSIGQRYPDGSAVPFGLSQIVAAPNAQSSCDSFLVQVLPSPLSCAKLRDSIIAQQGAQIGDLSGVALMQNGPSRTMLVPTAAGTCVLVSTRTVYGK